MIHGKRLVVVMPAFNAERAVEKTYREIPEGFVDEIVLVDDASAYHFGFNIGELSCPARYEPESSSISLLPSVKYGLGVLRTTMRFCLERWGLASYPIFDRQGRRLQGTEEASRA